MTVIELGLITDEDGQPPTPGPPRRWTRADLRRVLVALVAVLCLVTATGSAPPAPRAVTQLWSMPFISGVESYTLSNNAIYVLSPGTKTLSAYDLRTGARRWTQPSGPDSAWVSWSIGDVLLMPAGDTTAEAKQPDGSIITRQYFRDTIAVDTATGRQLWRQAGEFNSVIGDRLVLTEADPSGNLTTALRVVEPRTGAVLFSPPSAGLDGWAVENSVDGSPADRLVTATTDGFLRVFDLADGRLVTSGRVPWQPESTDESTGTFLTLADHRLYVDRKATRESTLDAYDTETLRRLWQAMPSGSGYYADCGPVLCRSDETGTTKGYDHDTGVPRWSVTGGQNRSTLPGDRLLFDDALSDDPARQYLLDATNGRLVADLGRATPVWNYPTGDAPYLLAHTQDPAGRMAVSGLDLRTGAVRLLDVIAPLGPDCQAASGLIVCLTQDQRLAVMAAG